MPGALLKNYDKNVCRKFSITVLLIVTFCLTIGYLSANPQAWIGLVLFPAYVAVFSYLVDGYNCNLIRVTTEFSNMVVGGWVGGGGVVDWWGQGCCWVRGAKQGVHHATAVNKIACQRVRERCHNKYGHVLHLYDVHGPPVSS
jgi:carbohydrate-binding DOMON domain-containing protein